MPRQRMIKPKFWDDKKVSKLSRDARLLFIGMWNFSDDAGFFISDAIWIKSKVFPYDTDIQLNQFSKWLTELETLGFINLVSYNKETFYYLPNFSRHQTINRPNEEDLCIPTSMQERVLKDSLINHGLITDESRPKISIREDKIIEDKSKRKRAPDVEIIFPFSSIEFLDLWKSWKTYKQTEFKKGYKSPQSEQAALSHLNNLALGQEATAREIIMQSIGNQWQGFFELKKAQNGKQFGGTEKPTISDLQAAHARRYPVG